MAIWARVLMVCRSNRCKGRQLRAGWPGKAGGLALSILRCEITSTLGQEMALFAQRGFMASATVSWARAVEMCGQGAVRCGWLLRRSLEGACSYYCHDQSEKNAAIAAEVLAAANPISSIWAASLHAGIDFQLLWLRHQALGLEHC